MLEGFTLKLFGKNKISKKEAAIVSSGETVPIPHDFLLCEQLTLNTHAVNFSPQAPRGPALLLTEQLETERVDRGGFAVLMCLLSRLKQLITFQHQGPAGV